ncbi:hypothetical protein MCHI_000205 [Candidatus Magnetoovum chiemensis]|nr:hypothetical protein MCHI_000205 [Candidatus Magnetoovum chiemensis]
MRLLERRAGCRVFVLMRLMRRRFGNFPICIEYRRLCRCCRRCGLLLRRLLCCGQLSILR